MAVTIIPPSSNFVPENNSGNNINFDQAKSVEAAKAQLGEFGGIANPDLYANVAPTIDESGIIRSMTVKPSQSHTVDLAAQVQAAVSSNSQPESMVFVSDMKPAIHGGGPEKTSDDYINGGSFMSIQDPSKSSLPQQPKRPDQYRPKNIPLG